MEALVERGGIEHDIVAVHILDPREMELPSVGRLCLEDGNGTAVAGQYLRASRRRGMRRGQSMQDELTAREPQQN